MKVVLFDLEVNFTVARNLIQHQYGITTSGEELLHYVLFSAARIQCAYFSNRSLCISGRMINYVIEIINIIREYSIQLSTRSYVTIIPYQHL